MADTDIQAQNRAQALRSNGVASSSGIIFSMANIGDFLFKVLWGLSVFFLLQIWNSQKEQRNAREEDRLSQARLQVTMERLVTTTDSLVQQMNSTVKQGQYDALTMRVGALEKDFSSAMTKIEMMLKTK